MAIYHVDVRAVQRSAGRSATAGAAYVAGLRIVDERTGRVSDYRRKSGVEAVGTVGWHRSIAELWTTAEQTEKHPRGITARTSIIALPAELDSKSRISCIEEISAQIRKRWSVAVTWAAHAPDDEGDERNFHGHLVWTTRTVTDDGIFGAKTRQLDDIRTSRGEITWLRSMIAETINRHLADDGLDARVDPRSRRARLLAGEISEGESARALHLGPAASAMERRGLQTDAGDYNRLITELRSTARDVREIENELVQDGSDPLNLALAAPSSRTSDEHATNINDGRARVARAAAELAQPSPGFGEGADRRERDEPGPGARSDLERSEPSPGKRAEPSRPAVRTDGLARPGDRAAPAGVRGPSRSLASRNQNGPRPVRMLAGAAAAQAILSRPRPALPPRDPPAIAFSQKGPDGPGQVRRAREAIHDKALKRLKERLKKWVLRAFAVVARRAPEPHKIPDGLTRAAYETGLRVGAAHPAWLGDPDAEKRAAGRLAEHLASSAAPPSQPSRSISRARFPVRDL